MVFALFGLLVVLAVPVGGAMALFNGLGRAREDDAEPDAPGIGTVRRLFLYALAFVSLCIAVVGVGLLVGGALDALFGDRVIADSDTELATALALTAVGLPAWLIFALLAQRSVRRDPVEARSALRWAYLGLVRVLGLGLVVAFAVPAVEFLVGVGEFQGEHWGWLLVGLAVWAGHTLLVASDPPPTNATRYLDRVYRGIGSVLGLYVLGVGLATLLAEAGQGAYDALFRETVIARDAWHETARVAAVQAVVGGLVWWWHWIASLRRESATGVWQVVVFLFGILAGLAVAVTAAARALYLVLEWFIDEPEFGDASTHFADMPWVLAALVAGLAAWAYHRAVLDERAPSEERRTDPERIYRYLVAAAGLLTLAWGLTALWALVIDALAPVEFIRDAEWWREDLALTLTLLVVGAPLWARYWFAAQRVATAEGVQGARERDSLPRRAFLFVIFGVAVFAVLVNLAVLLFEVFDATLEGTFSAETVRDARWSLGILLTAGAISGYYWLVLRDDQAAPDLDAGEPARPAAPALREVVLIAPAEVARAMAERLEGRGMRVRRWDRVEGGPLLSDAEADAILDRLVALDAASAVLLVEADGEARVLPAVPAPR